jgi:hypothetical protein
MIVVLYCITCLWVLYKVFFHLFFVFYSRKNMCSYNLTVTINKLDRFLRSIDISDVVTSRLCSLSLSLFMCRT